MDYNYNGKMLKIDDALVSAYVTTTDRKIDDHIVNMAYINSFDGISINDVDPTELSKAVENYIKDEIDSFLSDKKGQHGTGSGENTVKYKYKGKEFNINKDLIDRYEDIWKVPVEDHFMALVFEKSFKGEDINALTPEQITATVEKTLQNSIKITE